MITIKRGGNITIQGDTTGTENFAELKNVSLNIRDYSNVIIRNLKMHEVFYPSDDLTIDHCHHVWIDHCEFHSVIGPGIGVDTYDGLLDIKKGSQNVTVSWCYFHDHMKTLLMGHSDNNGAQDIDLEATFHHNWFSNTNGRNPSLRFGHVHYYNNYLEHIDDYGFAIRNGAHAKIENCHFESVNTPIATDKFEGHGYACVSGSVYTGNCSEHDNQISEPTDCDFWENMIAYEYTLEDIHTVAFSVMKYAGVGKIYDAVDTDTTETSDTTELVIPLHDFLITNLYVSEFGNYLYIHLNLPVQEEFQVSLHTLSGQRVFSKRRNCMAGEQRLEIQVSNYVSGLYIVTLHSKNHLISKKILL